VNAAEPDREGLHARVAGMLEHAFNPIMLKELRASLRGTRFFVAHLVILCLFAAGLLMAFLSMIPSNGGGSDDVNDPSEVGRRVYLITQFLQLGVAFLVVPGLAATSVSTERESLTHDLLLTTTMTARQIVWGKFSAAMMQAFTIFVSMVPLVGLCFLFGGVTVYQIVANYTFLFALSATMIAFALSISANARSTQRAVGSVYGLTLLGGGVLVFLAGAGWSTPIFESFAISYGFVSPGGFSRTAGGSAIDRILYVHLVPAFGWAAATSLFFINATNRLKPLFANRSTPLRIYYATVLFSAGAIVMLILYHAMPDLASADDRSYTLMAWSIIVLTASLLGALFACEEAVLPDFLARESEALTGPRRLLRLLQPGADSGAAFTLVTVGLFLALSSAAFLPYVRDFNRGAWIGWPPRFPLAVAMLTIFGWTFLTSTLARYLSALLPGRPLLLRTILILSCLFLALFPLIHWAVAEAIDRDVTDPLRRNGPITLILSPIMAVLSALDLSPGRRDFPLTAARIPLPLGFGVFSLLGGVAFLLLGNRAKAKLRKELAEEETPAS
jgi:ABC-2 type transport system permease protein